MQHYKVILQGAIVIGLACKPEDLLSILRNCPSHVLSDNIKGNVLRSARTITRHEWDNSDFDIWYLNGVWCCRNEANDGTSQVVGY